MKLTRIFLNTICTLIAFTWAGLIFSGCSGQENKANPENNLHATVSPARDLDIQTLERVMDMKANVKEGYAKNLNAHSTALFNSILYKIL